MALAASAIAGPVAEVTGLVGAKHAMKHAVSFGINEPGGLPAIEQVAIDAGRAPTIENLFVKLDSTSFTIDRLQQIQAAGRKPMLTIEPWSWQSKWGEAGLPDYTLASIYGGRHDSALKRIARTVVDYKGSVFIRFAHEANGWWYPWAESQNGNQRGDYVRAWRHVRQLFSRMGAGNVRWVWAPNAVTGAGKEVPLEQLYPGDEYVDIVGMTAYGHGPSVEATIDPTYRRLVALTKKPIMLAEVGADGPEKLKWISAFASYVASHERIYSFVWYNTSPATTGASGDYRFNDSERSSSVFASALERLWLS